jgi:DNA-binding transcriptional regulator LsrR (DeoR family)
MKERNDEIVRRFNRGDTASQIGVAMGITKNTVIGVIKRARPSGSVTREPMDCRVEQGKLAALVRWGFRRRMRKGSALGKEL